MIRAFLEKRLFANGALVTTTSIPPANNMQDGWAKNSAGASYVIVGAPAISTGARQFGGLWFTNGGLHIVDSAPVNGSVYKCGFAVSSAGQLHCDSSAATGPNTGPAQVTNYRLKYA